jgi:DNA-binding transcriptional LysR family regulator
MVRSEDNPLHKDAMDFLRRNGVLPSIQAEVEDPDLILAMTLRGEGVGFLDPFTIQPHLERGRLVKLHERSLGIRENLWLLCSRHEHSSAPVQAAIDDLMGRFRLDWRTLQSGAGSRG